MKSDCRLPQQRKLGPIACIVVEKSVLSRPVHLSEIDKNGQNSSISDEIGVGILCRIDCMAEGETFEPSVQLAET